jgi:phosphoribosylformylglycinamidine cyclo-ligase
MPRFPTLVGRGGARTGWTYARSGVDRGSIDAGLSALLRAVRYRPVGTGTRPLAVPGHFAGLVRVGRETIAITTDTVGTKSLLAAELGSWEGVGEDIVGVNVNDLAAVGARPCGLVDCLSLTRPDPAILRAIGRGLDRGLRTARCALLGGETAVVPDVVRAPDLGGTAIGWFPAERRPVTGATIRVGDVILGIPSSGVHANGFTLVRRLLRDGRTDVNSRGPSGRGSLGEELLAPTRIYSPAADAVADLASTHGLAHLSGGGVRNLVRLHPQRQFILDRWPVPPPLFEWIRSRGRVTPREMFQTFNQGIGFVLVVAPSGVARTRARLAAVGTRDAVPIGHVEAGRGVVLPEWDLQYHGYA